MNQELKDKIIKNGYKGNLDLNSIVESMGHEFSGVHRNYWGKKDEPITWTAERSEYLKDGTHQNKSGLCKDNNFIRVSENGNTPEEAIVNLWIRLNKVSFLEEVGKKLGII